MSVIEAANHKTSHQLSLDKPGPISRFSRNSLFDYAAVSLPVAKFLRGQAERIRRQSATSVIQIGKSLVGAKHYLSHGAFLCWVEGEVGIPARTAQVYMQVAEWSVNKSAMVAHLPPSLLYLLSAPSTPKQFVDDVLTRIESGESVTLPSIRGELKAIRELKRNVPCGSEAGNRNNVHQMGKLAIVAPKKDSLDSLLDAVGIMARQMPEGDFGRVRDIMTSKQVLDDPDLPAKIVVAFRTLCDLVS